MLRQKLATLRKSQTCGVERERGEGGKCGTGTAAERGLRVELGAEGNVEQVIQFNENFIDVGPNQ